METILAILAVVLSASATALVVRAGPSLRDTTLLTSWRWAIAAMLGCTAGWTLDGLLHAVSSEWSALLWCAAAIVVLCPPIAVLGARRPGGRVWNWFVLLPLAAVLGWPALTVWSPGNPPGMLQLEGPALIGFVLAVVMGVGNYIGTRYRYAAALVAVAEGLILWPLTAIGAESDLPAWTLRLCGVVCLGTAAFAALRASRKPHSSAAGVGRVWTDFRDTFGIVWAHRVQEQINARASAEKWNARLHADGIDWDSSLDATSRADAEAGIEQTLRRLLRRFVNEQWIDERLGRTPLESSPSGGTST